MGWYAAAIVAAIFAVGDYLVYCWLHYGSFQFGVGRAVQYRFAVMGIVWEAASIVFLLLGAGVLG